MSVDRTFALLAVALAAALAAPGVHVQVPGAPVIRKRGLSPLSP